MQALNENVLSENVLSEQENIHPSLVGMAVDYLSRYMLERNAKKAFHISTIILNLIFAVSIPQYTV